MRYGIPSTYTYQVRYRVFDFRLGALGLYFRPGACTVLLCLPSGWERAFTLTV